uniref:Major facilitator superfamily (MFS) profile domain-containing protein n=1 Tax=Chromera velia CCMP2878 TaxID=1169474 RepID=A0A0G4FIE2_9ALVE|eukprot:Cvel_17162.t1-p1 / transcript=Cvel_17162.t1 / gene=Cvel_17162 / organism=Chromera_velia_CCMP2878 / gene_product=Protein spinster homolog 3, putative / transcript_product=Protein spinster homolog 3, putative / location=Cvel_scaffold1356:29608-33136(+) / protein_length=547 / sequence_SO=supercontig / SO=protein_coding / is_pseudo=false
MIGKHKGKKVDGELDASRTQAVVCVSSALDGADGKLLPASFRALESQLGMGPSALGLLSLAQSLCQAVSSPVWGYWADRGSRKKFLAVGCCLWAGATILLAFTSNLYQMVALRALNGVALSCVSPISQGIVVSLFDGSKRGEAFGWIHFFGSAGSVAGGILGTSMSEEKYLWGVDGWRLAFCIVGFSSLVFGWAVWVWATSTEGRRHRGEFERVPQEVEEEGVCRPEREEEGGGAGDGAESVEGDEEEGETQRLTAVSEGSTADPDAQSESAEETEEKKPPQGLLRVCLAELSLLCRLMRCPSFTFIVLQGVFGAVPWNAFGFATLFMQYCGLSNFVASVATSSLFAAGAVGGVVGGMLGDFLSPRLGDCARPLVAQISKLVAIPATLLLLHFIPRQPETAPLFIFLMVSIGFVATWPIAGTIRPILCEITLAGAHARTFSFLVALEGSSAALFGAPVVALLAERVFGYSPAAMRVESMSEASRLANADALAKALTLVTIEKDSETFRLIDNDTLTTVRVDPTLNSVQGELINTYVLALRVHFHPSM